MKIEYRSDNTHKKCTQIRGFRHKPSEIHPVNKQNRKNEKKLKKKITWGLSLRQWVLMGLNRRLSKEQSNSDLQSIGQIRAGDKEFRIWI